MITQAQSQAKALPETGKEDNHQGLIGGMLAAFGGLTLLGRRRKKEEK